MTIPLGTFDSIDEMGTEMLNASDIGYWASEALWKENGSLFVRDADSGKGKSIRPKRMAQVHHDLFFKKQGCKGVHPSNYAWITEEDDYDSDSTDWAVQVIMFGEVIYG